MQSADSAIPQGNYVSSLHCRLLHEGEDDAQAGVVQRHSDAIRRIEFVFSIGSHLPVVVVVLNSEEVEEGFKHALESVIEDGH
jgi:hypothetical protein